MGRQKKNRKLWKKQKEKLQAEAEIPEETVQEPEIEQGQNDHRKVVALESTEDYTDYSIGFFLLITIRMDGKESAIVL